MADNVVIAARGVFYAPVGTALPTISASPNWTGGGWTQIPEIMESGVELSLAYADKKVRPLGSKRPTKKVLTDAGVESVKFQSYRSDTGTLELAIPDGALAGSVLSGGGSIDYYALAIESDNAVWLVKKVSATGKLSQKWENENFTDTPFEFEAFEVDTDALGTTNYSVTPKP